MKSHLPRYILVLDDDPWHVSWIEDIAEVHGFKCQFASTYEEATAAYDKLLPEIAVVDIRIGDVSTPLMGATLQAADPNWIGLRFLRFVRVERLNNAAALFVYTGLDREELQRIVQQTFASRFFTKFDSAGFRRALTAELSRAIRR